MGLNVVAVSMQKKWVPSCLSRIALEYCNHRVDHWIDGEYSNKNPANGPREFVGEDAKIEKEDRKLSPSNRPDVDNRISIEIIASPVWYQFRSFQNQSLDMIS